ncbi:hypothetical protein ANN_24508 [Periplaneta americana]|uniref:PiggyBac transposable element-derived protein domain-containing protein n=1 Tax=Periplaneta americana TaxID=6978 RepID=A0ABQ8S377_PERAM|nr:hypothetical protein ANN_24508 [Periplaneta americana]
MLIFLRETNDGLSSFSDGSRDNYVPSSHSSSESESDHQPVRKKYKSTTQRTAHQNQGLPVEDSNAAGSSHRKSPTPVQDHVSETIDQVIQDYMIDRDEGENDENGMNTDNINWGEVSGNNMKLFDFTVQNVGVDPQVSLNYADKMRIDFFLLFIDDEIIDLMVTETNRYASQKLNDPLLAPKARLRQWKDTNSDEMKFMGILIWMGLVRYPKLENYWSTRKIYDNYVKKLISRNRFQLLLSMWHFHDNENLGKYQTFGNCLRCWKN